MDAAIEQFRSSSYGATSTEELCACTGLSRSSLYNTFHSKSAIFAAALRRYDQVQSAGRAELVGSDGTGIELLEQLLRDTIAIQFRTEDRRTCMVLAASVELGRRDDEVAELARRNLSAFAAAITKIIDRGQCDGSIRADLSAAELAALTHATVNGLQILGRVSEDDAAIQRTIDTTLHLLSPATPTT